MKVEQREVVVIGGGPAGASTAGLLAAQGHDVLLVDRSHFPRVKACAEYMSPGLTDLMHRLGLSTALRDVEPQPITGMEIVSAGGKRLRVQYGDAHQQRQASSVPREVFDSALIGHARSVGAEVREGVVAKLPVREDGRVIGVEVAEDGRTTQIRGRLTIVADGTRSAMARGLGLTSPVRWPRRLGLVSYFQGEAELSGAFGQMHVRAHGYCGVAPLPDGRLNVAVVVKTDAVKQSGLTATAYFDRWIEQDVQLSRLLQSCRRVTSVRGVAPIGSRVSRAWAPGCLLVGDAAGFFDPFTGEGIYRAVRGAELASLIAHSALRRNGDRQYELSSYSSLRREAFQQKSAVTALVQLFVQYPGLLGYAVPRLRERQQPREILSNVLGDLIPPAQFLRPSILWSALRP